jgi:hypothetical protein
VSRESLTSPLPIGWQREYDYQSPRLLQALEDGRNGRPAPHARARLALRHVQPRGDAQALPARRGDGASTGTGDRMDPRRYDAAKALILTLRDHHDRDAPQLHPHQALIDATAARLREGDSRGR